MDMNVEDGFLVFVTKMLDKHVSGYEWLLSYDRLKHLVKDKD